MLSACMILLLYPLIADIRKSRFYIGPVLICTLILMGIGIVRGKITLFSVLTGWIPGMMMVMMSRWTNGKIGEGDGIVVAAMGMLIGWYEILLLFSQACFLSAGYGLWLKEKAEKTELSLSFLFCLWLYCFFRFSGDERKVLMRKVEGSMTVEASLLMPMVIFILAGLCYSFFFMHDYIVMQNEGYRRTEAELWHRETEEDMPVFMMSVLLDGSGKSILQQAADWVNHQSRAHLVLQGELKIPVPGIQSWTGGVLKTRQEADAIRVDYTRDRVLAALKREQ